MDYLPIPRLDARPYRNILHEFDSYNYTIVLRVFKLEDLKKFTVEGGRPNNWDVFDNTTVVIAATGGTASFPNRWGSNEQHSDTFIENTTITIPLGARGIGGGNTGGNIQINIKEPNGVNFLPTLLTAFNVLNDYTQDQVLSSTEEVPILLSIFFNAPNNANAASSPTDIYQQLSSTVRHIPIRLIKVGFNISSSGTAYNIEGCSYSTYAQFASAQRALYEKITELKGYKIKDYLEDLAIQMNSTQEEMTKDQTTGTPRTIYSYSIVPVGKRAEIFFDRTLSSTLTDGGSIADSPMKSPQDIVQLYEAPTETSDAQVAGALVNEIQAPVPKPLKLTDADKIRRRLKFLAAMDKYGIVDPAERAQFYAQCLHESGTFKFLAETANGRNYDITVNPKKAAALGNTVAGDGPRYKGRGYIQVTGKSNYAKCGKFLGKDLVVEPALLEQEDLAAESACWFWVSTVRTQLTKRPNSKSYIKSGRPRTPVDFTNTYLVTHIVNGGFNGLEDRLTKFGQAKLDKDVTKGKEVVSTGRISALQAGAGANGNTNPTAGAQQQSSGDPSSTSQEPEAIDKDAIEAAKKRKETQLAVLRAANSDGVTSSVRSVKLGQEMTVTSVVELLALNSTYCLEAIKNIETEGMPAFIPYIKVYPTYEFLGYDPQFNVLKKRVTFNVVGIEWASPAAGPVPDPEKLADEIKNSTIRGYNYLFTGKNIDILSLDLNFNTTFYTANARYIEGSSTNAAASSSSVESGQPTTPVASGETGTTGTSASGSMSSTANVLPDRDTASKGMPKDFNETEMRFKSLLPSVFANSPDLITLDMEIVGDPALIAKSEMALTAEEFKYQYLDWEANREKPVLDRSADPTGFSTSFFLFTLGNPDPTLRSNAMVAGYYQYMTVTANFKESGAFTMNVNAVKDSRLTVSTPEAKAAGAKADQTVKENAEATKEFSTTSKELTAALKTAIDVPGGSNLTSTLKSLVQVGLTNFEQTLSTGLSTAAGSFANNLLSSYSPKVTLPTADISAVIKDAGSIPGMPSDFELEETLPASVNQNVTKDLVMFVNLDPNPTKDVTKPIVNSLFDQFATQDKAAAALENFVGSLVSGPDIQNQLQNMLSGSVNAITDALAGGLTSAASGVASSFLAKTPALLSGNGKALAATGNLSTTSNAVGALMGQAIQTAAAATPSVANKLSALLPGFKVPGAPGLTTENSAALQPSLASAFEELASKSPDLNLPATSFSAPNATTVAGDSIDAIQSQLNSALSPDQLKLEARASFNRITDISKGIKVASPSLSTAANATAKSLVNAVGGQSAMPGSASSLTAVAKSAGSAAGATVAKAAESIINKASNNPLMSAASSKKLQTSFTQDAVANLAGLTVDTVAALAAAQPQTANLIKNLPLDVSTMSALSSSQIASIKEKFAVASLAGSGAIKNLSAGSISTDINAIAVSAKGLAQKSLSSVKQSVSVSIKGVI